VSKDCRRCPPKHEVPRSGPGRPFSSKSLNRPECKSTIPSATVTLYSQFSNSSSRAQNFDSVRTVGIQSGCDDRRISVRRSFRHQGLVPHLRCWASGDAEYPALPSLCHSSDIFVGRGFSHDIKPAISVSALAPEDLKRGCDTDLEGLGTVARGSSSTVGATPYQGHAPRLRELQLHKLASSQATRHQPASSWQGRSRVPGGRSPDRQASAR
jgi:hypothetical protein